MIFKELKDKTAKDLKAMEAKLAEELFHLRIKNKTAQLEKKSQIPQLRHDIARIKTRLTQLAAEKN